MPDFNSISPYIHYASHSWLSVFSVKKRIILDYELILIEKGVWEFIYEGRSYSVGENDIILIPPGKVHEMRKVGDSPVKQPHIHFDICYDKENPNVRVNYKLPQEMTQKELSLVRENIFEQAEYFSPVFRVRDTVYFKHLFFEVIDSYTSKPLMYELVCKSAMISLLRYIFADQCHWGVDREGEDSGKIPLTELHQYITKNFFKGITREEISRLYNYNASYLDRRFHRKYGLTPMEYYHSLRVNEIKRLLRGGIPCADIVNMLSFSSAPSFSRYFKQKTGMSPSGYIEKHR